MTPETSATKCDDGAAAAAGASRAAALATGPCGQRAAMLAAVVLAGLLVFAPAPAGADWLGRILQQAAESGSGMAGLTAMRHGEDALAAALERLKSLPDAAGGKVALAVHAGPEGHWTFVNKAGERYTAGSPEELERAPAILAPLPPAASPRSPPRSLRLILTPHTVFVQHARLGDLPRDADLELLFAGRIYPLTRMASQPRNASANATGPDLLARMGPNVVARLTDAAAFSALAYQLSRPILPNKLRIVSLEPGGPALLAHTPGRSGPSTPSAPSFLQAEPIDPFRLPAALSALRGQTVIVSGRIDGDYLGFAGSSGSIQTILLSDLYAAARRHDVNLVVVQASSASQPGTRNWLLQRITVDGLQEAAGSATFGDILDTLGSRRGRIIVSAETPDSRRTRLAIAPAGALRESSGNGLGAWLEELAAGITGSVAASAIQADLVSQSRQSELDRRIVPGIPSLLQGAYIGLLVLGLIGSGVARGWWNRIWPPENRKEYGSRVGYMAARAVKWIVFLVVFLPMAGVPAFMATAAKHAWALIGLPFRLVRSLLAGSPRA